MAVRPGPATAARRLDLGRGGQRYVKAEMPDGSVVLTDSSGRKHTWTKASTGGYKPPPDQDGVLAFDSGGRTAHCLEKADAAASTSGDPAILMLFTLGLVAWPLAMPQIRRMLIGPDHSLDALRPAITDAVRTLVP
ncbi:hypothetical protein [Thermomonospora umbrina]|uniref:hypothetical protein n=1 Tax=Thermomonospora umbrina TaxID=111806 RepID=UPI0011C0EC57|nr:hypothetical protein [Thermomonospora umbrina]